MQICCSPAALSASSLLLLTLTMLSQSLPLPSLVPAPLSMEQLPGTFLLDSTVVVSTQGGGEAAAYLARRIERASGIRLKEGGATGDPQKMIRLVIDPKMTIPESYRLQVNERKIEITAGDEAGFFYGAQTLLQLFPPEIYGNSARRGFAWRIPAVLINDQPRFAWRGMHLDVGRHFFPVETIKKYIEYLAMHKQNTFHWHLTEDQGWRIEIKKYPRLAEVAAWRKETLVGSARTASENFTYDGKRYGGYYTHEEIREVVAFAAAHHVTVIPEIELPGHSTAALAAYPELACTRGPFEVATYWGVHEDVFCPKEATFEFLENVLREVIDLFPSEYIHIGGDECPKTRWESCTHCQDLIRREGLKDEHGLQSWFIQRIEKFLNQNGRKIIGWDEISEGGLSPTATVMFWRSGEQELLREIAGKGNKIIMTPTAYVYFDYYQSRREDEPLAIGGYLPAKKVYEFDPMPADFTPEMGAAIWGTQGNIWTEYIPTSDYLEYMAFPRLSAIAEVAWTLPENKDWEDFRSRMRVHFRRLDFLGVNYARHILYEEKKIRPVDHLARGATIVSVPEPTPRYGSDAAALVDGRQGMLGIFDETWRGYEGSDFELTVDLGELKPVKQISINCMSYHQSWIFLPRQVDFYVSQDNKNWQAIGRASADDGESAYALRSFSQEAGGEPVRYVRLVVDAPETCPDGHPGAGSKCWVFVDEVVVK